MLPNLTICSDMSGSVRSYVSPTMQALPEDTGGTSSSPLQALPTQIRLEPRTSYSNLPDARRLRHQSSRIANRQSSVSVRVVEAEVSCHSKYTD
jgi:hypothetical protein